MKHYFLLLITVFLSSWMAFGQHTYRPDLFFREDWKEIPAETPLSQKHVDNSDLILNMYGPGKDSLRKSHHDKPIDDPYYVWSGLCFGNWMVSLKHKTKNVDLSEFAKIRFRSKQSGLRELRITLKLSDGSWLVSNKSIGTSKDWMVSEFNLQDITWHYLDENHVTEIGIAMEVNLSNVEEIGFTDLMAGIGRSKSSSRLDWIEVYGKSVKRN